MKTTLYSIIAAALLLLMGAGNSAFAEHGKISVKGESVIKFVPDEVLISFSIVTNDLSIDRSESDNHEKTAAVLDMIHKHGVEGKDVQTDYIKVEPQYEYLDREQKFTGYKVTRTINVTLHEISKTDEFIAEAVKLGANDIQGIDYQSSKLEQYQETARLGAIRSAKHKAESLANELNEKVGRPVQITEDAPSIYYGNPRTMSRSNRSAAGYVLNDTSSVSSTTEPGEIEVRAQVSVTFELE